MSKMFNYEADQIHEMVHPDLLTDTTHYVAECKDIILNEVTPNYPKLTEYEKEWFYFANHIYQDGQPVNLEYQIVNVDGYARVENAIPFCYKSAILKGITKYRDIDTGDILDTFDETKNLELVSVKMPALKATGKNLFDVNSLATDMPLMTIERVKDGVRLKANESQMYRCSYGSSFKVERGKYYNITYTVENENPNNVANVTLKNINGDYFSGLGDCTITGSGTVSRTFLAEKSGYVRAQLYASMGKDNGAYYVTYTNVMISKVSNSNDVNVEHEPYQSNSLTVNEEVTLRGIGDAKDELNLLTGELTQRIGEIVLDGSVDENWANRNNGDGTNTITFQIPFDVNNHNEIISDKFALSQSSSDGIEGIGYASDIKMLFIEIKRDRLNNVNVDKFKQWLSQNPITVQYKLTTESVKTVDLNKISFKPYEGTNHFYVSSDTIPPRCTLSIPVESTGAKTLMEISQED